MKSNAHRQIKRLDIDSMDRRYRANLINSIPGFKSANLIGTQSKNGIANLAVFNSVIHLGSNPPLLGMTLRPLSVPRHTFDNLSETGYFTINHIHSDMIEMAHQTSAKYDCEVNEFKAVGFEQEYLAEFSAPFVKESRIRIGMRYLDNLLIRQNNTRLIIGEIELLDLADDYVQEDGSLDLVSAGTVSISGLDSYYLPELLGKMPYARAAQEDSPQST